MYIFNRVTVVPQLPQRINKLSEIANKCSFLLLTNYLFLYIIILYCKGGNNE